MSEPYQNSVVSISGLPRNAVLRMLLLLLRYASMVLIFASLFMACMPWVQAAVDPTAPMVFGREKAMRMQPRPPPKFRVSSVLVSDKRRLAVINGQLVSEGQRISGALVREINIRGVLLERNQKHFFLALTKTKIKQPVQERLGRINAEHNPAEKNKTAPQVADDE